MWSVLKQFGGISQWHPVISESLIEGDQADGLVGCIRRLTLQDGAVLRERLLMVDERDQTFSYCFEEAPLPLDNYIATVRLVRLTDQNKTVVQWTASFDTREPDPKGLQTQGIRELIISGHESLQRYLAATQTFDQSHGSVERTKLRGATMDKHIEPVPLDKAYRLLNHGPTVLVSARNDGTDNVMAAAWACALDYSPPKLTVVLDKIAKTRDLVEKSGTFVIQVPTVAQLDLTYQVGHRSLHHEPDKLVRSGVKLFEIDGYDQPLVAGCSAWLVCRLIPESHNQDTYDLFIGEIVAAWSDTRVFKDGHWCFETADPALRSLHHVAGGHFYAIGQAQDIGRGMPD